jgi:hypothetical protein
VFCCSIFFRRPYSQPWIEIAESKKASPNFYDIQQAFTEYYDSYATPSRDVFAKKTGFYEDSEVPGFFQYKRWEYFWQSRVSPQENFPIQPTF